MLDRAFEPVLAVVLGGKLPKERNTVAECSAGVVFAVLEHLADGETRLGRELAHLSRALSNFDDPALSELGVMERASMRTLLGALRKLRGLGADLKDGLPLEAARGVAVELVLEAAQGIANARSPEEDAEEERPAEAEDRRARR